MTTPQFIGVDPGTVEYSITVSKCGPVCPCCGEDGFDDWWHEKTIKPSMAPLVVSLEGSLKCHGCGKFFRVEKYVDGEVHCSVKRSVRQELN